MDRLILKKDDLGEFFKLLKGYTLLAPVSKAGSTSFEPVPDPAAVTLDLKHQPLPPKKAILPQTEILFSFDKKGAFKEPDLLRSAPPKRLVFGLRPCDARSFAVMDPVYAGEDSPDPYYLARRSTTVLAGLQCSSPFPNCFCTSVGGGPSSTEGLDLLFVDCDGAWLIDVLTEAGSQLVKEAAGLLSPPTTELETRREQVVAEAARGIRRSIDLEGLPHKLEALTDHPIWEALAQPCISCGVCTYTCPTCYCFDIQDERIKGKGRRVRLWDSCMFNEYALHASGHNPRPTRAERLRNRLYHKFQHQIQRHGVVGCVGCGRCITLCPANEDLITNLQRVGSL